MKGGAFPTPEEMKRFMKNKLITICLAAVMLTGCSSKTPDNDVVINTEKTMPSIASEISETSSKTITTSLSEQETLQTEETTAVTLISSEKYVPTDEEQSQIQKLLLESKKFFFDYWLGKDIQNYKGLVKKVEEFVEKGPIAGQTIETKWYEVTKEGVKTMDDLKSLMTPMFTDKMIESLNLFYYKEIDGKLYVSDSVGSEGGGVGTDTVHITSVGKIDDETLVLYMIDFGAGENWELDHDLLYEFTVTLKRMDNGFKIDECNSGAAETLAWRYNPEDDIFS